MSCCFRRFWLPELTRPAVALLSCCCLFAPALAGTALAGDWPQFRGPDRQGHSSETGLASEWSPTSNVVWKQEVPGSGWSSPVVVSGKVYLTSAVQREGGTAADVDLTTLCLDAGTGETVWSTVVFEQDGESTDKIHSKNSHASPTPLIEGDRLYVHFGTKGTACLDLTGKVLWRNDQIEYSPQHGNGGSPVLVDGVLIVSCDGSDVQFVTGLDAATGKIRWKQDRPAIDRAAKFSFTTPLVITVNGRKQVVSPGTNHVVAYDPTDGSTIWKVAYDGFSVIPRPVYGNGLVYICTGYGRPSLLAINPDGSGDVTETHLRWKLDRAVPHTPSLLLIDQELYLISDKGVASCVDALSGEVHWTERVGGNFSASPVYADGKIYFQSEQGDTTVIRPGSAYDEVARNSLGERTLASFAVADSALFIRTDKHLYRIDGQD